MIFRKKGVFTTLQDTTRVGYAVDGIFPSGPMDEFSAQLANILVGNSPEEACLEIHFPGPTLEMEEEGIYVLTGADFAAQCGGRLLSIGQVFYTKPGDILTFTQKRMGMRTYLARAGGFGQSKWLNSSCLPPFSLPQIQQNVSWILPKNKTFILPKKSVNLFHLSFMYRDTVRFVPRPDFLVDTAIQGKLKGKIQPNSSRMGMYIQPENLALFGRRNEQLSGPVVQGSMQLLPSGNWVVLMADHQTTGGYPVLGEVISADLPILAQAEMGSEICFEPVGWEEAVEVRRKQATFLQKIKVGIVPTFSF